MQGDRLKKGSPSTPKDEGGNGQSGTLTTTTGWPGKQGPAEAGPPHAS